MSSLPGTVPVLELTDVCFRHGGGGPLVLDGVSLRLEGGPLVLVGESGAGKSTLLRMVAGLLRPDAGKVRVRGVDPYAGRSELKAVRRSLGVVLQEPRASLNPSRSALDSVAEPLVVLGGCSWKEARNRASDILLKTGLGQARFTALPAELSGGECQRVSLARALVRPVDLILADEPTANLDPLVAGEIVDLVVSMIGLGSGSPDVQPERKPPSLLWVTHRLSEAQKLGGTVLVLLEGRVVESLSPFVSWDQATHPYTRHLLERRAQAGLRESDWKRRD